MKAVYSYDSVLIAVQHDADQYHCQQSTKRST